MRFAFLLLSCILYLSLSGCASQHPATVDLPSLAQAFQGRLLIGTAVEPEQLSGAEGQLIAQQFNSLVAENAMKPARLQPREGQFDFARADAIAHFAEQHHMQLRGHTLLWYKRTPDWFWVDAEGKPASRELVLARLKQHIQTVVSRYHHQVYAWDVVNEVIDASQPNCLRDEQWLKVVGPDYIAWAFRYAHEADPAARLFINDYSTTQPEKRACLQRIVSDLLAQGVPVHGVGHQMHISIYEPSTSAIDDTLSTFAKLGLENQITEWDMSLYARHTRLLSDTPERLLAKQGERYGEIFKVFLAHPELSAVTWWGASDAHTWLNRGWDWWRSDQPLLFDGELRAKPGFWAVLGVAK